MKVTSKKSDKNKRILDIEVPRDTVRKKFDEVYEKINQEAKVPGFRPGKVPRQVLEQHHAKLAREEVLKSLISETYQEGVNKESLEVIDLPTITEVKLEGEILSYRAEVEVRPEVKIKQYKGLKLKKQEIKVEPSEVEEAVKQLKQAREADISDERLAKGLGYQTKEEMAEAVTRQIYLRKDNEERTRLEREIVDQLVKNSALEVPASLVTRRAEELEHQTQHQMQNYGMTPEQIAKRIEEARGRIRGEAEEQVKVFLILETIAKAENLKSDDRVMNRVIEFLFAEAQWS